MKTWSIPVAAICLFFLQTIKGTQGQEPSITTPTRENALILLADIENRFANLKSIRYHVNRTSQKDRQAQTERWIFSYKAPDSIRIDYFYPQERVLVVNSHEIWEYIPRMQKAMKTDLKAMTDEEKQKRIASTISRISVDGLHPGAVDPIKKDLQRVSSAPNNDHLWILEGLNPKILFEIDAEHSTMLKSEIYDSMGNLILKTDAADFTEITDGFWFPHQVKTVYRDGNDFITASIVLEQVELNPGLSESLFQFSPPSRVEVVTPSPK